MSERDSNNHSDVTVKDWTFVNAFGEVDSDDGTEEASTICPNREVLYGDGDGGENVELQILVPIPTANDSQLTQCSVDDVNGVVDDNPGTLNTDLQICAGSGAEGQMLVVDGLNAEAGIAQDLESLSSGSSIELLDMPEDISDTSSLPERNDSFERQDISNCADDIGSVYHSNQTANDLVSESENGSMDLIEKRLSGSASGGLCVDDVCSSSAVDGEMLSTRDDELSRSSDINTVSHLEEDGVQTIHSHHAIQDVEQQLKTHFGSDVNEASAVYPAAEIEGASANVSNGNLSGRHEKSDVQYDEDDVEANNIDDRCESDISGVANDDSDLSSMAGIDDLPLIDDHDVIRLYHHQPNSSFNSLLTLVTVLAVCCALGIGIGHYIGSTRMSAAHRQQMNKLKSLKDDYAGCLNSLQNLETNLKKMKHEDEWHLLHEQLSLEKALLKEHLNDLLQANQHLTESLRHSEEKFADSQLAVESLSNDMSQLSNVIKLATEAHQKAEIAAEDWKIRYEQSEMDRQYLQRQLELKNTKPSELVKDEVSELKNIINTLKTENVELKADLLSQRYTEHPGNGGFHNHTQQRINKDNDVRQTSAVITEDQSGNVSQELSAQFVRLQHLLKHVDSELKSELIVSDSSSQTIFITLLRYLLAAAANSSDLVITEQMGNYRDALQQLADCVETIQNVSVNQSLARMMTSSWQQLTHSSGSGDLSVSAIFACQRQFERVTQQTTESPNIHNVFQHYVNSTMETVTKLSKTIQTTLDQMKTIPDEIFADNKTAQKIGRKFTEAVSEVSKHFQSGWKHVKTSFGSIKKKFFGYGGKSGTCKRKNSKHHREDQKKCLTKGNEPTYDKEVNHDQQTEPVRKFDDKRTHKQTQSLRGKEHGPQRKNDFMHIDDYVPDGFLEGNQREWRLHNDRLQAIRGRMQRLNEDIFLSMDDDEIEDMYEALDDVEDEIEERDESDELRAWMTCQLRWWKTRLHRKHRGEDLVKGCGRQLMHWQLRVLCKSNIHFSKLCRSLKSSSNSLGNSHTSSLVSDMKILKDSPNIQQVDAASDESIDASPLAGSNTSWTHDDTTWYFRRVQDREDHHYLSPQWYFDRMEDRQYSRFDANWYVRAIHRGSVVRDNDNDD